MSLSFLISKAFVFFYFSIPWHSWFYCLFHWRFLMTFLLKFGFDVNCYGRTLCLLIPIYVNQKSAYSCCLSRKFCTTQITKFQKPTYKRKTKIKQTSSFIIGICNTLKNEWKSHDTIHPSLENLNRTIEVIVSEHMGWVRSVVLMNVYLGLGKP
jgi:hypothetical protein